jgi:hypothetical protein
MEKSVAYNAKTAVTIVRIFRKSDSGTKALTISFVNPSVRRPVTTTSDPSTMYGLRRPHLDFVESDITPMTGCTIRPDSGPAIHTIDVWPFVRPRERR